MQTNFIQHFPGKKVLLVVWEIRYVKSFLCGSQDGLGSSTVILVNQSLVVVLLDDVIWLPEVWQCAACGFEICPIGYLMQFF
jgi:hypothetical protein